MTGLHVLLHGALKKKRKKKKKVILEHKHNVGRIQTKIILVVLNSEKRKAGSMRKS